MALQSCAGLLGPPQYCRCQKSPVHVGLKKRRVLFKSFVESQFAYCPLVWMFHDRHLHKKINHFHERAVRIVYKDDTSSFESLLERDESVSFNHRNLQSLAIEVYKFTRGKSVSLMEDIFSTRCYSGLKLRSNLDLETPSVNTVYKGDDSLRHLGPLIWKIVPENLKRFTTIEAFKTGIKNWKPYKCPCRLCKEYIPVVGYIN